MTKRPLAVEPSPAFWPFAVLAGALLPARFIARRYLPRRLALWGFDPFRLPPGCLRELADWTLSLSKARFAFSNRYGGVFQSGAGRSLTIWIWRRCRSSPCSTASRSTGSDRGMEDVHEPIRQILARHGVWFPEP
jgi:hypothetical protein